MPEEAHKRVEEDWEDELKQKTGNDGRSPSRLARSGVNRLDREPTQKDHPRQDYEKKK